MGPYFNEDRAMSSQRAVHIAVHIAVHVVHQNGLLHYKPHHYMKWQEAPLVLFKGTLEKIENKSYFNSSANTEGSKIFLLVRKLVHHLISLTS